MKAFQVTKTIRATPEKIWALLTDAPGYQSWNNTVTKVEGRIALGERIAVHAKISPTRPFKVKVTELSPSTKMVWADGMPLGLFQGVRTYTLTPAADGGVEFFMREVFSGPLSFLIEKTIPDLQPVFEEFANDLKKQAEKA